MAAFDLNASSAMLSIEALTDSEILCIPIESIRELLKENIFLLQIYNRFLANALERHWEIKNILHKQTAKERYQWFLEAYPGLIDRVSNKHIASFLGMTPVTLSRLRRVLREKEHQEKGCRVL